MMFLKAVTAARLRHLSNRLLDDYPSAAAAFSVRLLDNDYGGSCIRVRRASDNTEQDIGFTSSGNLNTSALATFCTGTNGFIRTWYDQSGNARNATQTTTASQPKIYDSSTGVVLLNSKPAFDHASQFLTIASSTTTFNALHNGTTTAVFLVAAAGKVSDPNAAYAYCGNSAAASAGNGMWIAYEDRTIVPANNAARIGVFNSAGSGNGPVIQTVADKITPNTQTLVTTLFDADNATAANRGLQAINGSATFGTNTQTRTPTTNNAAYNFQIGAGGNNSFTLTGYFQEMIIYLSDQSSNRSGIETNINSYFSIY